MNLHRNGLIWGETTFCHWRVLPLKFLHALEIDQALLPHTPRWDWVPPKILIVKIKSLA